VGHWRARFPNEETDRGAAGKELARMLGEGGVTPDQTGGLFLDLVSVCRQPAAQLYDARPQRLAFSV